MQLLTSDIAHAVGGTLVGSDVVVEGVAIDSRLVRSGQLFVALVGERDGHDFVGAAREAGAAASLTSRPLRSDGGSGPGDDRDATSTWIVVDDTVAALAALGAHARDRLPGPVVGITGSVGKTSTKDMAAAVIGRRQVVAASEKSFNNELGVPLTLVNAPDDTEATVIEMGTRGAGHIAALCKLARPSIAVVTAVELVHSELIGGLDAIARAKGELPASLPADGTAVLNGDDPRVAAMAALTDAQTILYGIDRGDVRATKVEVSPDLRARFLLESEWGDAEVHLGVRGHHHVANALAAATVSLLCGVTLDDVVTGLAEAELSPWRMDLQTAHSGALVLNDAYNAGPASMAAALRALAHLDADRHHAVLGPMAELGPDGPAEHRRIATLANELGVRVVAVGTTEYGVDPASGIEAAFDALGALGRGDAVVVKGSRVAGLERLAERLLKP